jgi:hypothetical protein
LERYSALYSINVRVRCWSIVIVAVWFALPAARLACAMSCSTATAPAPMSCHDSRATGEVAVKTNQACVDHSSLVPAATVQARNSVDPGAVVPAFVPRSCGEALAARQLRAAATISPPEAPTLMSLRV